MPKFNYSTVSTGEYQPIESGLIFPILNAMQRQPAWDEVQIRPVSGCFPLLHVSWHSPFGYIVQCFEAPQSNGDFLSIQSSLSEPTVYVDLGGQTQELWPKELFTPIDLARRALEGILELGCENTELTWIGISDFPRKTVRAKNQR